MSILSKFFAKNNKKEIEKVRSDSSGDSIDKLINGELPWGWRYAHKDFLDNLESEYRYFLNEWIKNRNGNNVKLLYESLKSFIIYIRDVRKALFDKGECFIKYYEDFIGDDYLVAREKELKYLEENFVLLQKEEKERQEKERLIEEMSTNLEAELHLFLKQNDGILQSEITKHFDSLLSGRISEIIYKWRCDGKIIREKSGRSFKIHLVLDK